MTVKIVLLALLLSITLFSDLQAHKIRNIIVIPFFMLGLTLNTYYAGLMGLKDSLGASLLPILILGIFFALRMMGAGDLKLLAAIGALMGISFVSKTLLYSVLCGGIIALVIIISRHNARERFKILGSYIYYCFTTHSFPPYSTFGGNIAAAQFPYTCAIIGGVIITLLR